MRTLITKTLTCALACLCVLALTLGSVATQQRRKQVTKKYKIFCVDRIIEIEDKTLEEIREENEEREVCELTREEFENLYQALDAAKQFGGAGEPCECGP